MIIVALIVVFVLVQKAQYLHEVYFHNIDSPPYQVSEHDVMTTLSWRTTLSFARARLVTLASGLRPERRFAPLARGIYTKICYFPTRILV